MEKFAIRQKGPSGKTQLGVAESVSVSGYEIGERCTDSTRDRGYRRGCVRLVDVDRHPLREVYDECLCDKTSKSVKEGMGKEGVGFHASLDGGVIEYRIAE